MLRACFPCRPRGRGAAPPQPGVFSDHYLNATLPARPGWRDLAAEAGTALEEISGLLDSYTPKENERIVDFGHAVNGTVGLEVAPIGRVPACKWV